MAPRTFGLNMTPLFDLKASSVMAATPDYMT